MPRIIQKLAIIMTCLTVLAPIAALVHTTLASADTGRN